jgi:hypothetical protein
MESHLGKVKSLDLDPDRPISYTFFLKPYTFPVNPDAFFPFLDRAAGNSTQRRHGAKTQDGGAAT